jgi:hypothetical protein
MLTSEIQNRINAAIDKAKEEIEAMLEGDPNHLAYEAAFGNFPITYSQGDDPSDGEFGPPILDPFILRVTSREDYEFINARYQINLKESVEDIIDDHISSDTGKIDDKGGVIIAKSIRDAFLDLAKMLDDKIA